MTGPNRIENAAATRLHNSLLCLAAAASVASSRPAVSQQAEVAPRGQREVKDVTYGDWRKLCFKPGGAQMHCRTSITGKFSTGQMAVRLDIIEREVDGNARLQVFSPVGMYLQKPVMLTVDQGQPHPVPYTWCLTNTCIAGAVRSVVPNSVAICLLILPRTIKSKTWRSRGVSLAK